MNKKISVYHIDDHKLIVQGIYSLIGEDPEINWLGSAHTGTEGVEGIRSLKPEVLLLDYFLPDMNGLEVAQQTLSALPETSILILSMETDPELIKRCKESGILGFLPKSTDQQTLLNAIRSVYEKQAVFPKILAQNNAEPTGLELLSKREKEIAQLIAQGYTSAQISEKLFISLLTVNTHRRNIINKLELSNTAQLSAWFSKLITRKF